MGSSSRYRQMSPAGKHMIDPMRASTGTMQLSASHNEPPTSRQLHSRYPSDASYSSTYDPRSPLEAQPVSSTTYRGPDQRTKRTEYAIRRRQPRIRSSTASAADGRLTVSPTVSSPLSSRTPPVITASHSRSSSPWTADSERYMVPGSSHSARRGERRIYNVDHGSDTSRVTRPKRYHVESTSGRRYPVGGLRKGEDIDQYDAYSYTNPEEQFERDSVDRLARRRGINPRSRPLSMAGAEDLYSHLAPRKESRALGPPPTQRGFDKLDRDARVRRSTYGSGESDREATGSRRPSRHEPPVSLHHRDWDDGYYSSSYRDGYYDDSYRHYRPRPGHHGDNEDRRLRRNDHADPATGSVAGAGAALGTAGLASGYGNSNYDLSRMDRALPYSHDYHHSRSRRPPRRRANTDREAYTSDEDLRDYPSANDKYSGSEEPSQHLALEAPRRRNVSRVRTRAGSQAPEKNASRNSSGSSQEGPKKSPEISSSKEPETQPKSILKPPRERFPEEPNPVREGVAPLKDAHKKGIPPGARWTKVDRRMVNPASLAGQERYVDRDEYMIILRVLTKEEIQAYAVLTQEIRDARYQEYVRNRRRRRDEGRRRDDSSSDDEDEDGSREQLTLEAPPERASSSIQAGAEPAQ